MRFVALFFAIPFFWLFASSPAFSQCLKYEIVDRGDTVEAVCIGAPPTEAEKRQEARDRAIQERQDYEQSKREREQNKRQSPPDDPEKCYHETFGKMTFKGLIGLEIAQSLARDLCSMSIERKECVMKMIGNKTANWLGFSIMYDNALKACQ